MTTLFYIIITSFILSLISLLGALFFLVKENILKKLIIPLVALSAGTLFGGAIFHLIPESIEETGDSFFVMLWMTLGFVIFLVFEQFIHWHHCHKMPSEHKHPVTYMILISDGLHNFIDGLTLGAAFLISPSLGFVTAIAIALHEIPQELGDFGILVHGGWQKGKAILFNFLSGLTMILGGILIWFFSGEFDVVYLLAFAAGNFLYISASDLIPEFKGCTSFKKNSLNLFSFLFGIILMILMLYWG